MGTLATDFLGALERCSRSGAIGVVASARAAGAGVADIVEDVIRPAQHEVGLRWERNEWSVAQEHAATMISDIALTAVAVEQVGAVRGRLVAGCVTGEWHAVAVRLVAEQLRELGWDVTFLGASLPAQQLERFLQEHRPDALLLGVTLAGHLPYARDCVDGARRARVPVVLGGAAVRDHPQWAGLVGAASAERAVSALDAQIEALHRGGPVAVGADGGAAARCEDVLAHREEIATEVLRTLPHQLGSGRQEVDELIHGAVPHVVEALAASMLVDDGTPLREFAAWLRGVLAARSGPGDPAAHETDALLRHALTSLETAVRRHAPAASGTFAEATRAAGG